MTDSIDHSFPKHFFIDSIHPSASHCFSPDDHRSNVFCRQSIIDVIFWLTVPTYASTVNLCYFADIPHAIKMSYPNVAFQILWFTGTFFIFFIALSARTTTKLCHRHSNVCMRQKYYRTRHKRQQGCFKSHLNCHTS